MSQKIPMRDFEWVKDEVVAKVKPQHIAMLDPNADTGYIFEVDVEIPREIHDRYFE